MPDFACSVYGAPYPVPAAAADCVCHLTQVMAFLMIASLVHLICCLAMCVWLVLAAGVPV